MKLKQTLVTVMSAFAFAGVAFGGVVSDTTDYVTETLSAVTSSVDGSLSAGYDSTYIFRGASLGDDAVWTGLDVSAPAPIFSDYTLGLGAWYVNPAEDGSSDELDLYLSISKSFGAFEVGLGYTAYLYPETNADAAGEISLGVGTQVYGVNLGALYAYDHKLETHYFEAQAGLHALGGSPLNLDLTVGFDEDSYRYSGATLSLPLDLTDSLTFTPYVAAIFRDDSLAGEDDDEIYAGASLSLSF